MKNRLTKYIAFLLTLTIPDREYTAGNVGTGKDTELTNQDGSPHGDDQNKNGTREDPLHGGRRTVEIRDVDSKAEKIHTTYKFS